MNYNWRPLNRKRANATSKVGDPLGINRLMHKQTIEQWTEIAHIPGRPPYQNNFPGLHEQMQKWRFYTNMICIGRIYVFGQTGLSKQWRPRSDTTERGIWPKSTLFGTHPTVLDTLIDSIPALFKF